MRIGGFVCLGLALSLAEPATGRDRSEVVEGRASAVDGDTLEIHGERIRLWGIDAPESRQSCRNATGTPWPCGRRSAFALSDLLADRVVRCVSQDRDRYGRLVARCDVRGEDLGATMVRNGQALDWPRYSRGAYSRDEALARGRRAGVWAGAFDLPWEWRRLNPR